MYLLIEPLQVNRLRGNEY
jgi:hypothetical protein